MQPAARRLLFLGWVILGSLVLLEVVLQAGAWVLRADPQPAPSDPDGYVVFAVGDSWVAGAEAPVGEGFVDGLARSLPEALDQPVSVMNWGRPGANSAYVALTVLDEAEDAGADLILVLVGQNNATNFAGVAEVEERLAGREGAPAGGPRAELRTVKLARIVWANLRGTEGYSEQLEEPLEGPPPATVPELMRDVEGDPVVQEPLLQAELGRRYLERDFEGAEPPPGPWTTLFELAQQRASTHELSLATAIHSTDGGRSVPRLASLGSYAKLRAARERGDWTEVKAVGDRLTEGNAFSSLGAAEAALLAGDWRRAQDLLTVAAHLAPGLADVNDLACRFPPEAADLRVQEHCEREPRGATALDRARIYDGTLQPNLGIDARRQWVEQHPDDLATRVDLAVALAARGDLDEADALMGHRGGVLLPPVRPSPHHWRYYVLRNAETGDRDVALDAASRALASQSTGEPHAALLGAIASVLAEHEACDQLPAVVERWYRVRGDVVGAARLLGACMSPGDASARLSALASVWGVDAGSSFDALARAGNRPLALLERDLDLVLNEARRIGARVVLLDYPNPSEDHEALASLIAEYAALRAVPRIALRDRFAARLDPDAWRAHIAPNGHCNARGYALMAEIITAELPPLLAVGASP